MNTFSLLIISSSMITVILQCALEMFTGKVAYDKSRDDPKLVYTLVSRKKMVTQCLQNMTYMYG